MGKAVPKDIANVENKVYAPRMQPRAGGEKLLKHRDGGAGSTGRHEPVFLPLYCINCDDGYNDICMIKLKEERVPTSLAEYRAKSGYLKIRSFNTA